MTLNPQVKDRERTSAGAAMRGTRFGFLFDYDQTYSFVALYQELAKRIPGSSVSGIVLNGRYFDYASKSLPKTAHLIQFYDLVAEGRKYTPSAEELADFRAFDEKHRLARVAYSDRFLNRWSYDELIPLYIYLIRAFREYIDREKPDIFVFDGVASQFTHLLYLVMKEKGVRVFIPFHFGIEDLFYFYDNPYFLCDDIWSLFRSMQDGSAQPSASEKKWAEEFIARIREGDSAYRNIAVGLEKQKFALPSIRKVRHYARYLQNYWRHDRKDPTLSNPLQRLAGIMRLRRNRKKTLGFFKSLDEIGTDFVFLPLQYEPEIATLVLSQLDQVSFIDMIVRQLPWGCKLVLKEHPAMLGQRPWTFFKQLSEKYPNIRFVDPSVSVNTLARRARATVTLSGTAIVETLVLQRPIVYASHSRFGGFGLGTFISDFLDFAPALEQARKAIHDDRTLVNMLSAILRSCARFQLSEPLGNPEVLTARNIAKVADAFMERLPIAGRDASAA